MRDVVAYVATMLPQLKVNPVSNPIEHIEIKIAYLEQANAELSDVVYRQAQELESLRAQLSELVRRLDAVQTPTASSAQDEIPPHY